MNLKQFIFSEMAKGKYITDQDVANFCRTKNWNEERDIPFCQAETYKREFTMLENQKDSFDEFEDKKISSYKASYKNAKTKYFLEYKGIGKNRHQPITKAYFNYLKDNGLAKLIK